MGLFIFLFENERKKKSFNLQTRCRLVSPFLYMLGGPRASLILGPVTNHMENTNGILHHVGARTPSGWMQGVISTHWRWSQVSAVNLSSFVCRFVKSTKADAAPGRHSPPHSPPSGLWRPAGLPSLWRSHSSAAECPLISLKSQNSISPRHVKEAKGRQITAFLGYYPCEHVGCQSPGEKFAT